MNRKAEIPEWVTMLIWMLLGLLAVLILIGIERNKLFSFLDWLG